MASIHPCSAGEFLLITFVSRICGRGRMPSLLQLEDQRPNLRFLDTRTHPSFSRSFLKAVSPSPCAAQHPLPLLLKKLLRIAPNRIARSVSESLPLLHSTLGVLAVLLSLTFPPAAPIIRPWHALMRFAE